MTDARRALPAIGTLLAHDALRPLLATTPRSLVAEAARRAVAEVRHSGRTPPANDEWPLRVQEALHTLERRSLRAAFNATGVVLHTNLGRAPLAAAALDAVIDAARGACTLEYDVESGERGSRYVHCVELVRELTGAEDAIVVNNCAAALVLALNSLCNGREAVISRGELIEIGGSFRVPDIMARSGAILREVGTTNRTTVADYEGALGSETGAIVKVHRSNFEMRGFIAEASLRDLAACAAAASLPLLHDFGSGLLIDLSPWGLGGEPVARDSVRSGATLVLMSGDKLLGGPQSGILAGTRAAVGACRRNPLCRALRVDKLTLAALEATLALYRDPAHAVREIPVLQMLTAPAEAVEGRARTFVARLTHEGIGAAIVETDATVGGGAFPAARLASRAVHVLGDAEPLDAACRAASSPVAGRIERDRFLLDLRSVPEALDASFMETVVDALRRHGGGTA